MKTHVKRANVAARAVRGLCACAALLFSMVPYDAAAESGELNQISGGGSGIGYGESSGLALANALSMVSVEPSTGIARSSYAFSLPSARGAIQPQLSLVYSSAAGNGDAGMGWSLAIPSIERRTRAGLVAAPDYKDQPAENFDPALMDRFVFSGRPLVPICVIQKGECPGLVRIGPAGELFSEQIPDGLLQGGWIYFRQEADETFARFFLSPTYDEWIVQFKSGEIMLFGDPGGGVDDASRRDGLDFDGKHVFRWNLVRRYDSHGLRNVIDYRWKLRGANGMGHLTDILYTAGAKGGTDYAHHAHLAYEPHDFPIVSRTPIWRATSDVRLQHVDVTSASFTGGGAREMVRRYRLHYYPRDHHHSRLLEILTEGRCSLVQELPDSTLPDTNCGHLPPTTFGYLGSHAPFPLVHGMLGAAPDRPAILDVNSDGLPDIVTSTITPQNPNQSLYLNSVGLAPNTLSFQRLSMNGPAMGANTATLLSPTSRQVVSGDWLGDGRVDVLWVGAPTLAVYSPFHVGGLQWTWSGGSTGAANPLPLSGAAFAPADINGDGLTDLITWTPPTHPNSPFTFDVYLSTEDPTGRITPFATRGPSQAASFLQGHVDFSVADIDGDGLPEVVAIGQFAPRIRYFGPPRTPLEPWTAIDQLGLHTNSIPPGAVDGALDRYAHVYLHDVNGDGLADIIGTDASGIHVWLNEDGTSFGARATDFAPGFDLPEWDVNQSVVGFADMNGSGVDDIVIITNQVAYIDMLHDARPDLLFFVSNGLGATTTLEYQTTPELARAARASNNPWSSQSPQAMHVVTSATTTNGLQLAQRQELRTEYTYRDPVYDARERMFRGFRSVRVRQLGDSDAPSSTIETTYLIGHCNEDIQRRCPQTVDLPLHALRGLPVLRETFDDQGRFLSTVHHQYRLHKLYTGIDGRNVRMAYAERTDQYLYDTASFSPSGTNISLLDIDAIDDPLSFSRSVPIRAQLGTQHLQGSLSIDDFGNETERVQYGRDAPSGDLPIRTTRTWRQPDDASKWHWAEKTVRVDPFADGTGSYAQNRTFLYDGDLNVTDVFSDLFGTLPLRRFHEDAAKTVADAPPNASQDASVQIFHARYDEYGNAIHVKGASGQCADTTYDPVFQQLPTLTTTFVGRLNNFGCGSVAQSTVHRFDRGFGLETAIVQPSGAMTVTQPDDFGRVKSVVQPDVDVPGLTAPGFLIEYIVGPPVSKVHVTFDDGNRQSWAYVDGLGNPLVTISDADRSAGDGGRWLATGLAHRARNGSVILHYQPQFYDGDPSTFPLAPTPGLPFRTYKYDAFGRITSGTYVDGAVAMRVAYHALSEDVWDAADLNPKGKHADSFSTMEFDGHGRLSRTLGRLGANGGIDTVAVLYKYQATGEVQSITQSHTAGADTIMHWMKYDSLGRMVFSAEPNSGNSFTRDPNAFGTIDAWRYAYDDSGQLVGTSDPRGCGKNIHYDTGGRLIAEDYSPCRNNHWDYTSPDLASGTGTEGYYTYDAPEPGQTEDLGTNPSFLVGRMVSVRDRGAHTRMGYDGRGRRINLARRAVRPGQATDSLDTRYAGWWFRSASAYDNEGHLVRQSTGADVAALLVGVGNTSEVNYHISRRGNVSRVDTSYDRQGPLVRFRTVDADGRLRFQQYGDVAGTLAHLEYDRRRRLSTYTLSRGAPPLWSTPAGSYQPPQSGDDTQQQVLSNVRLGYDEVDNPTLLEDRRAPAAWPTGAAPVTRHMEYDDFYRLTSVGYAYPGGSDQQVSPFDAEVTARDSTPVPGRVFSKRVLAQGYTYDWSGNMIGSTDDSTHGFFDRSLGLVAHGVGDDHPNQMRLAKPTATASEYAMPLYDAAGNLERLGVTRVDSCTGTGSKCSQLYAYDWDETGRLQRARRWDFDSGVIPVIKITPSDPTDADLTFAYSGKQRILTSARRASGATDHSVEILPTLRLNRTEWDSQDGAYGNYVRTAENEVVYLAGIARVLYANTNLPSVSGSHLHVLFETGDELGSTSAVFDQETSEIVERATYTAYGAADSDYRPGRWASFREQYRYTGKQDDIEVGLSYYGARYYSAALGRWISPDPLTVHAQGGDLNPYAFVGGSPLRNVDPTGTTSCDTNSYNPTCADVMGSDGGSDGGLPPGGVDWGGGGGGGSGDGDGGEHLPPPHSAGPPPSAGGGGGTLGFNSTGQVLEAGVAFGFGALQGFVPGGMVTEVPFWVFPSALPRSVTFRYWQGAGQISGGGMGIVSGVGSAGGGSAMTSTGVLAPIGVPVAVVGVIQAVNGAAAVGVGIANMAISGQGTGTGAGESAPSGASKPLQNHHFATDKNAKFTPEMKKIADRYKLDLDGAWNKEFLPHEGRHPDAYHRWVLDQMRNADAVANGDQAVFLKLYENDVKAVVRAKPEMLYKEFWE